MNKKVKAFLKAVLVYLAIGVLIAFMCWLGRETMEKIGIVILFSIAGGMILYVLISVFKWLYKGFLTGDF